MPRRSPATKSWKSYGLIFLGKVSISDQADSFASSRVAAACDALSSYSVNSRSGASVGWSALHLRWSRLVSRQNASGALNLPSAVLPPSVSDHAPLFLMSHPAFSAPIVENRTIAESRRTLRRLGCVLASKSVGGTSSLRHLSISCSGTTSPWRARN
jgi:hypothetical protein